MIEILDKNHINLQFSAYTSELNGYAQQQAHQTRSQAHALLQTLELPTTAAENWKYTNLRSLYNHAFIATEPQQPTAADLPAIKNLDAYTAVLIDGKLHTELSQLPTADTGINICTLAQAQANPIFNKHFGSTEHDNNIFSIINTAVAQQGLFIHIAANTIAQKTLHIINMSGNAHHLRHLIVADDNAEACVIENFCTPKKTVSFANALTEIIIQKNAKITHYKLQTTPSQSYHIGTTNTVQHADSTLTSFNFGWNGALVRNNINTLQKGTNCLTNYYGVYAPTHAQHIDNQTFIHHFSPHCQSNQIYKGLINHEAKGVFNGKILVAQDAQKINAYQSNKNILLSDNATINAKPQLEIFADDVKCSHGATVGQLDASQLFYLMARGISKPMAQELLTNAFAAEVFELCTDPHIKDYLYKSFIKRT